MRISHSITLIICAIIFSAASLIAFRYEIVVNASLIYRLDRWSGDIRVCIKQNPEDMHLLTCFNSGGPTTTLARRQVAPSEPN